MDIGRTEQDGIVILTMDDGDKNALDTDAFRALDAALTEAADARAVVLAGRPGVFTAGLNVKVLAALDRAGLHELLTTFGRVTMRLWTFPRPTVAAATGHAVAAGTILAMACDHCVAAEGAFRWGLVETRIDFQLPEFVIALARANVRNDRLEDLLLPGEAVDPTTAVEVGFADELAAADEVVTRAVRRAGELAGLPQRAYAGTKQRLRGGAAAAVLDRLDADIDALLEGRG